MFSRRHQFGIFVAIGVFVMSCWSVGGLPLTDDDFVPATFQQTFRFNYTKREDGTCSDLNAYRALLETTLELVKRHIPEICTVQNSADRITGQLMISDISEQDQHIIVNISLIYDHGKNSIYEQCKRLVQKEFEQNNTEVTSELRHIFFPLACPAISTDGGGVLVNSGYFCRRTNQIRIQIRPGGSSQPIDICVHCPPGKENKPGSNVCTECQQGFYKSTKTAALCDPCPVGFVTRTNGSTSRYDCYLSSCEAGSHASVTNQGHCAPCPFGTYQPDKWQEQCIPCPAGFTTYQRGAASKDLCLQDCLPGQEYSHTEQRCQSCPIGYYNDDLDPARYTCIMCNVDYITASEGTTSVRDCNIRNCTVPGQYRDAGENVCRDCPRGQWQNRKWQTSCNSCNVGLTTRYTGTSNPADCLSTDDVTEEKELANKDTIVVSMLTVLVVLVIGNLIIVGCCLYSRRYHPTDTPNIAAEEPRNSTITTRRCSWNYQDMDIDPYDIIQDVFPDHPKNLVSSAFDSSETPTASAENYDPLAYTEPIDYPVSFPAEQPERADLHSISGNSDQTVDYDDITNTCPVYQNAGSAFADSKPTAELWSTCVEILY